MIFVTLCKVRSGTFNERVARRMDWNLPEGVKPVAEYWLTGTDPNVVMVTEAASVEPMMAALSQWDDVFEMRVFPAIPAQQGLEMARQMKEKVYVGAAPPVGA